MTYAAQKFLASVRESWDSRDPWEQTSRRGLSESDAEALEALCDQTGEECTVAEEEVLSAVREHLKA